MYKCACGESNPIKFYGHKKAVCGNCHNKYTLKNGKEKRAFALEKLGGKCITCGFKEWQCSLDIHHKDPSIKDAKFSQMRGWAISRIEKEIENCVLLCKNCHAAFHSGHIDLDF